MNEENVLGFLNRDNAALYLLGYYVVFSWAVSLRIWGKIGERLNKITVFRLLGKAIIGVLVGIFRTFAIIFYIGLAIYFFQVAWGVIKILFSAWTQVLYLFIPY